MVLNEGETCQPAKRNDSRNVSAPARNFDYTRVLYHRGTLMMVLTVMKIAMTVIAIVLSISVHTSGLLCMPRAILLHTPGPTSVL